MLQSRRRGTVQPVKPVKPARKRRPQEVHKRIIEASIAAFVKDGFKGARMRSIARDAGITVQLLVYHVKSKDELWKTMMLEILAQFEELHGSNPLPAAASAAEKLRRYIADTVEISARCPQLHRIMAQEA